MVYALAKPEKYTCSVQDVVTQIRSGLVSNHQSFMPEEREKKGKRSRKAAKPFIVEWRARQGALWREWSKFSAYHTLEIAEMVIKLKSDPNGLFEYRIKPNLNS